MEEDQTQQQQPTEGSPETPKEKGKSSIGNWAILIIASVIVVALVYII